ncbi:ROK family protein [Salinarimonas soli]|uniref:ROK family protein n=1 Tax=Salinarimonas soli TaxID=1638099 RepID=A0A5B2V8S6_9HYPH|nr:ROK family protein [Salinarimonas soli]KAA2234860.1 ROK family protein [Salinarimonas soli]
MAFTDSDLDLAAPLAARAVLHGWNPAETRTGAALSARAGLPDAQNLALVGGLVRAGLAEHCVDGLRRTRRAVRMFVADLGGTKLHAAIVDEAGTVLAERREPTADGVQSVIDQITALRNDLAAACATPAAAIASAAIGVPGAVHPRTGRISLAPNIAGLDAVDLASELERRFGHGVRIENDVNLAALGESADGCARGVLTFAFVSLGTGIGMGLVLDGRLVRGHRGMAGEIALLPVAAGDAVGRAADEGSILERAIGSNGILCAARAAGPVRAETVEQLFAEARHGSPAARAAIAATSDTLFDALMAVRAVVDPELVVLGGSIGLQAEIADRVASRAESHADPLIVRTSTLGPYAVLAGASLAALSALLAPARERRRGD